MKKWMVLSVVLVGVLALGVVGAATAAWWLFSPVQPESSQTVQVEVPRGTGSSRLATILTEHGLIRHPLSFRVAVKALNLGDQLQAGVYQLSPSENAFELARRLTRNTNDVRVTLPEGLRAEEVIAVLEEQLNITADNPQTCVENNGYLFPETYSFVPGTTVEQACTRLRQQFDLQWEALLEETPAPQDYTQAELVTLAALVQREAKDPEDMKRVAGVLFNRLEMGMPLQIDATLQYAKGYDERTQTWWPTPLAADKTLSSPYNTYQNAGLPAGPIANPGREALQAVLTPIITSDLYYISTLDGSEMFFAPTYQEHMRNINRYLR